MSRPRPPYLHRTVTRHGKIAWYVWKRPGRKIRLHGEYGSKDFLTSYHTALWGGNDPKKPAEPSNSLASLIGRYRQSSAWWKLAEATRRHRGNMLDRVSRQVGHLPATEIDRAMIVAARDDLKPGAGKCLIDTLRGLFKWAKDAGHVDNDPTQGIKVQDAKTDGFETWSEADIAAYERRWPVGSRERLWLAVLLYTGLRRSDAVTIGRDNIVGGTIEISTKKTGTSVVLPLHPELNRTLSVTPLGRESFIGLSENAFGKALRKACDAAGVKGSAHGLRKAAAARLAEAGASVPELNAVFGWTGAKMALRYTEKADRARLARQAIERSAMFSPSKGGNK